MRKLWLALFLIVASCAVGAAQSANDAFTPDWDSLSRHTPAPKWFQDAKFGIYFHWGVYSVPAFGNEWYPRNMYDKNSKEYAHHVATYGDPSKFGYPDFVPMFKAEKFDPVEWADLFVKSGARFAGPVGQHHDGFAMWASDVTPWNAGARGPKRDIAGELAQAIRARGMKFIMSFHHARNNLWDKPDRTTSWSGHYAYVKENFPALLDDPDRAIMYGYMPRAKFLDLWLAELKEVVDKYHPDIMWFDSWLDEIPDAKKEEYLAYYFNAAQRLGQEPVVTFKQEDLPQDVGLLDLEKGRMDHLTDFPWLTDDTISRGSWCYTENLTIKPTSIVLHGLIDIVSKNGVLLLNISPMADGTIPQNQRDVLLGIGQWLGKYGEAIYDTRPWYTYGEGPTQLTKGRFGGVTDAAGYTSQDIRYTTKGTTIYAIVLGSPQSGAEVSMTSFAATRLPETVKVSRVTVVGSNEPLDFEQSEQGLRVRMPKTRINDLAVALKIER